MTQLTKPEACQLHDALSHLSVRECTTEMLTALLKLRQICATIEMHKVSLTCSHSDSRVQAIKIIRSILGNGLKEAKDMLDTATSDMLDTATSDIGADMIPRFREGGGTLEFEATPTQIYNFKNARIDASTVVLKIDGVHTL